MAGVLSWQNVSPYKRILLSKRLSSPGGGQSPLPLLPDPGDSRRNKIFPSESLDSEENSRLKDALSFSYSMGDSGLGTSLTQSSQSSRRCTESTKSSRKQSRSSLQSTGTFSINSNPRHRGREDESIFTIKCLEVREGEENSSSSSSDSVFTSTIQESGKTEYKEDRIATATAQSSYRKYMIKEDHNHRKDSKRVEKKQSPASIIDIPEGSDSHGPVIISGVLVPELVEELNDAYNDLLHDIGLVEDTEDDHLPSCLPLLLLDYIFLNISSAFDKFKNKR